MYKLCQTEQSAIRQRELEQKLREMMNQFRYEEITVSDFCAYAGIPRKAFYRYFSSKEGALYALLDHTMLEFEFFRNPHVPTGDQNLIRELEGFFRFWKNQKLLLDALEHSGISGVLMERVFASLEHITGQKQMITSEDPKMRDHVVRFAVCGIMIMMVNWHHDGYRESITEMARIAARLVSQPLLPVIREVL